MFQVRVGRIAGQYAKPRSSNTEKIGDREVLSFRYVSTFIEERVNETHSNLSIEVTMSTGMTSIEYTRRAC